MAGIPSRGWRGEQFPQAIGGGRWLFSAHIGGLTGRTDSHVAPTAVADETTTGFTEPKLVRRQDGPASAASPLRRGILRLHS